MPKRSRRPSSPSSDIDGSALVESLLGGWRALARLDVDGFALLRSRGVTSRANSIVPIDPPAEPAALAAAVERLEGLAEAAGQTPTFRLFTAPRLEHGPLRELLLARGYVPEGHTLVQQRELPAAGTAPHPGARILVGGPDEDWLAASWRLSPRPEEGARETTRDLMAGTPAVYVSLPSAEGAANAAVGRAALVTQGRRTVAVLDAIAVDPAHRREGWAAPSSAPCSRSRPSRAPATLCSRSRSTTPQRAPSTGARASAPVASTTTSAAAERTDGPGAGAPRPRLSPCLRSDETTSHASPTSHGSSSPMRRSTACPASSTPSWTLSPPCPRSPRPTSPQPATPSP
ncbi:hypothetical protein GCM10028787_13130 [Brachybacterium horti]